MELPAMYLLGYVVTPTVLPTMHMLVDVVPPYCVAWYVCGGWGAASPLFSLVCMCWLVLCHPIVLPIMHVPVDVEPPHCVVWYVCAG